MQHLPLISGGCAIALTLLALAGCARPNSTAHRPSPVVAPSATPGSVQPPAPSLNTPPSPTAVSQNKPTPFIWPASKQVSLFDGKTLSGWKLTDFAGAAEVKVVPDFKGEGPAIVLDQGVMTGITWTNDVPREGYEISLEAMRVSGGDFFCGLTFPVGKDPCSLIIGGWGGGVVGLSSVDSEDAAHNETTKYFKFETGRWYRVRLRVTPEAIQAWLDDESIVNQTRDGHVFSIRVEVEQSKPLGISTWSTTGAIRKLDLKAYPR